MASDGRPLTANQQARRRRILEATLELVTEHGYHGTVMRDVATRADVSATTLYNLYNTKSELLLAALRERIVESVRLALRDAPEPGYRYLLALVHHVAESTRRAPEFVTAISEALFRAAPGDELVTVLMDVLRRDIANSLEQMQDQDGLVAHCDTPRLASALTGAFWSTFLLWHKGLIGLAELEPTLRQVYLSLLIPASRGETRAYLEDVYRCGS